jgi:hypothetical protein
MARGDQEQLRALKDEQSRVLEDNLEFFGACVLGVMARLAHAASCIDEDSVAPGSLRY